MKSLNEFKSYNLNENLEKAKKDLEKLLDTQGFEVYIDDSGKTKSLVISVDELIKNGAEYPDIQKAITKISKAYKLKTDKMSNDEVVFLTEGVDYRLLHEKAVSKSQRRLFALALQYKQGDIEKLDLEPQYAEDIIKISEMPEDELKKFASTKETNLPDKVEEAGENFAFSSEPLVYPAFVSCTNSLAKSELMKWWYSLGLSQEQQASAMETILKVQYQMYTNFYLGNPGLALKKIIKMKKLEYYLKESDELNEGNVDPTDIKYENLLNKLDKSFLKKLNISLSKYFNNMAGTKSFNVYVNINRTDASMSIKITNQDKFSTDMYISKLTNDHNEFYWEFRGVDGVGYMTNIPVNPIAITYILQGEIIKNWKDVIETIEKESKELINFYNIEIREK